MNGINNLILNFNCQNYLKKQKQKLIIIFSPDFSKLVKMSQYGLIKELWVGF